MKDKIDVSRGQNMYIIPKGAKDKKDVIKISPLISGRYLLDFPRDKYQIISDNTLNERGCTLEKYIQNPETWEQQ